MAAMLLLPHSEEKMDKRQRLYWGKGLYTKHTCLCLKSLFTNKMDKVDSGTSRTAAFRPHPQTRV